MRSPFPGSVAVVVADDEDWTWVLDRPCPACGFDASTCPRTEVAGLVRANAARWRELHEEGRIVAGRPDPATWSPLEYACHVRDVYRRYDQRMALMGDEDDPLYPNWDQDRTAVDDAYEAQDPAVVLGELEAAAEAIARRLEAIRDADLWDRPGRRSDGASFTLDTISRYMVHDPIHHIWDVTRPR